MSTSLIDVRAYLERIGISHDYSPNLETLRRVQAGHTETIAFETISPFLGGRVCLDPESLEAKLVRDGRGGYCYEQNSLLWHVLRAMGFRVSGLAGRVLWNIPDGTVAPRTHMLLLVGLESGDYVVDVGFGGMTPTGPLRLEPNIEQETPHERTRLVLSDGLYILQARVVDSWRSLYEFDLQRQHEADYEVANWYHSTCPSSPFVSNLLAARAASACRHSLFNNRYSVHHLGGETETRLLSDAYDLVDILETAFGLRLPDDPAFANGLMRRAMAAGR